jgi:hypothetical protein
VPRSNGKQNKTGRLYTIGVVKTTIQQDLIPQRHNYAPAFNASAISLQLPSQRKHFLLVSMARRSTQKQSPSIPTVTM